MWFEWCFKHFYIMAHRRNSTNGDKYLYKGVKRSLSIENDVEKEYIFENEEDKVIVDQGMSKINI